MSQIQHHKTKYRKSKKTEEGILTLDFIFSFFVTYAVFMIFMFLSFTLMFSSVSQYIVFSAARAKASSHISLDEQRRMGERKFDELTQGNLKSFYGQGKWFELRKEDAFHRDQVEEGPETPLRGRKFYGITAKYVSNILDFRVPLLGSTADGLNADEFSANMSAFIYREPSTEECQNFNRQRWSEILKKFPELNSGSFDVDATTNYGSESDNGC